MTNGAYCPVDLGPGYFILGNLGLPDAQSGYCLTSIQIGWPDVRQVVRNRALGDGTINDTQFMGGRAITVTMRLDQRWDKTQTLLDNLLPYVSPYVVQTMGWALPGWTVPEDFRYVQVKGVSAPLVIDGPKYRVVTMSFVTVGTSYLTGIQTCEMIYPSDPTPEPGRLYDLTFDRIYPASNPPNTILIYNEGTAPTDWVATLNGAATNPSIVVNGITMSFNQNGGLTLTDLQSVIIDTGARTILTDAGTSVYDRVNFEDWSWADLRLMPRNTNSVSITGTGFDVNSSLTFCWTPYYF